MFLMFRKMMQKLIDWKETESLKDGVMKPDNIEISDPAKTGGSIKTPALLTGCRGVGKTWLALDFAKNQYPDSYLYFNLEQQPSLLKELMDAMEQEKGEILANQLSIRLSGRRNLQGEALIIWDEIGSGGQPSLETIRFLCRLNQFLPDFHFLLLSSFAVTDNIRPDTAPDKCGVDMRFLSQDDRIDMLKDMLKAQQSDICTQQPGICTFELYCMDFEEYLYAIGHEWYVGVIWEHFYSNKPLPDIVHQELTEYYHEYLRIGGFPAALSEYLNTGGTENLFMIHRQLMNQLYGDMTEQLGDSDAGRAKAVWLSVPEQLSKANKVFRYRCIRKGATRKLYQNALDYLIQNSLIIHVKREARTAGEEEENFKLYYPDTGILLSTRVDTNEFYDKGTLENQIALTLRANGKTFSYWESESQAKIDFILTDGSDSIPVELFLNENTRSKSISIYRENHTFPYSIKLSCKNFGFMKNIKYVPIYAAFCLK